ncbi:hypothetical protein [Actinomadura litoris]|uniref:hypothetical protein n=1 Tax=Actinomadura litoris TaxID=2678616 RepID=UPI001FA6F266|nr:hypothetical protein [Actinomadura litoris]
MSYESRAYDNAHGDPVVVLVTTGTHDVSRLMNLLAGHRIALCEHVSVADRMLRQVRRHNGGRAALALLREHGGPDLSESPQSRAEERARVRLAQKYTTAFDALVAEELAEEARDA